MTREIFNPDMLILARESRSVTQSELAKRLSVSQANISKIEAGMLGISDEQIKHIAEILDYQESFFFQPSPRHGFASNCLYHRKRQSVPVYELRRIIAEFRIFGLEVANLLRAVEIETENRFHRMDMVEYESPELIAQLLRRSWGLPLGPIQNLTAAIENAGGIIIRCSFGTRKIDAMSQWAADMPPLIFVNSEAPGDRLRYSLAHEIGHIIMHQIPTNDMEREADKFAAELLMPKVEIAPYLSNVSIAKLASLKPHWKVSMAALLMRAGDLKKVTQRQKEYLWTEMGKRGYRLKEPIDIAIEQPRTIYDMVETHLNQLGYSVAELSNLMHSKEDSFRLRYLDEKVSHLRAVN
jgi:Zn-dependent peptidase ImmA (M78 family)/DNA-binding XRE family transcriptional regulator